MAGYLEKNAPLLARRHNTGMIVVISLLALVSAAGIWYWNEETKIARLKLVFDWESRVKVLAEEATSRDLTLAITSNEFSVAAVHQVDQHELDAAVIPAGLGINGNNLRHVTFIDRELLHLFVKPELLTQGLAGLRGRRIWLGTAESDIRTVAGEVLKYVGLHTGDFQDDGRPFKEILKDPTRMPDAVFTLSPLPSERGEKLARRHGYQLMELPFGEAISITKPYLEDATVPVGLYSAVPAVPDRKLHTIGIRSEIIAHKDVSEAAISRLLAVLYESDYSTRLGIEPLNERLLQRAGEYPMHGGTRAYLHRNDPWLGTWLSTAIHWLTGTMLSAVSAALLVWQWYQRRQRKVGEYLRLCNGLDLNAQSAASRGQFNEQSLGTILAELSRVKAEVLKLHHESYSAGDKHFADIVSRIEVLQQTLPTLIRTVDFEKPAPVIPKRRAS